MIYTQISASKLASRHCFTVMQGRWLHGNMQGCFLFSSFFSGVVAGTCVICRVGYTWGNTVHIATIVDFLHFAPKLLSMSSSWPLIHQPCLQRWVWQVVRLFQLNVTTCRMTTMLETVNYETHVYCYLHDDQTCRIKHYGLADSHLSGNEITSRYIES